MSWQDEIRRKKKEAERRATLGAEQKASRKKRVRDIWNRLLEANNRLDPDIKLFFGKRSIIVFPDPSDIGEGDFLGGGRACLFLNPRDLKGEIYRGSLCGDVIHAHTDDWHTGLQFNQSKQEITKGEYIIQDTNIDTLVRNLCKANVVEADEYINLFEGIIEYPYRQVEEKKRCFIASAVYECADNNEVLALRTFRDQVLDRSHVGKLFVMTYYFFSHPIADFITE
jgi:hypothetical protein